jgi:hypothetical protein
MATTARVDSTLVEERPRSQNVSRGRHFLTAVVSGIENTLLSLCTAARFQTPYQCVSNPRVRHIFWRAELLEMCGVIEPLCNAAANRMSRSRDAKRRTLSFFTFSPDIGPWGSYGIERMIVPTLESDSPDSRETLITFEDLSTAQMPVGPLPKGYSGLTWSESAWFVTRIWHPSASMSGQVALLNANEDDVSFERQEPFDLLGLTLSSLWGEKAEVVLEGWRKGVVKHSKTLTVHKNRMTRFNLDYRSIDRIVLKTGGVHILLDDIILRLG